ncbi:MAG: archaeosortase/exosortase family protein, partial [Verrucomicrobiae bacterium]|nr:archaeosortase/exosortase family protein [Verrucomicrobiae bacterium]
NFRSPWRRLLVIASSVPFALIGNILRLVVVFVVGEALGEDAGKMIETKFGFITYLGALAGLFCLGWFLREPGPPAAPPAPAAPREPAPEPSIA